MNRAEERYGFIPILLKRLFTWGLLFSALFFAFWYLGGVHVWAYLVMGLVKLISFFQIPCHYDPDQKAIVFLIQLNGRSKPIELGYFANQWNLALAELVLLSSLWWSKARRHKLSLLLWSLGLILLYQATIVLLYVAAQYLGPELPNQLGVMWEHEGSLLYALLKKVRLFETLIGRYWVGFPIFGVAVLLWMKFKNKGSKKSPKSKKKS